MQHFTLKHWLMVYLVLVGLLFLIISAFLDVHQPLKVSVLDIGQGDAILIQTPEYHNILIDAGPDGRTVDQLSRQMGFFDKTIDLFILTHPHRDHYVGILDMMQKYQINKILLTGISSHDPMYLDFLSTARDKGVELVFIQNHQDIQISANLYLDVIYPFQNQSLVGQDAHNKNNTSIVARLMSRKSGGWEPLMMLPGDAEIEQEREILLSGQDVAADILKLGHHGSKTATSDVFLAAVSPLTAVISAGEDNKFGHPHEEVMEKVKDLGVYQTAEKGAVEFVW